MKKIIFIGALGIGIYIFYNKSRKIESLLPNFESEIKQEKKKITVNPEPFSVKFEIEKKTIGEFFIASSATLFLYYSNTIGKYLGYIINPNIFYINGQWKYASPHFKDEFGQRHLINLN